MNERRRSISVGVLALSAAGMAGCGQRETVRSAPLYASVEQCAREHPQDVCRRAQGLAQREQWSDGPGFSQQSVCEAQYGRDRCQPVQRSGGVSFVPIMAGFMLGQALNRPCNRRWNTSCGGGGSGYVGHPVYVGSGGRMFSGSRDLGATSSGGLPSRISAPFTARGAIGEERGVTSRGGFGRGFGGGRGG